jgi:hypothetical protein
MGRSPRVRGSTNGGRSPRVRGSRASLTVDPRVCGVAGIPGPANGVAQSDYPEVDPRVCGVALGTGREEVDPRVCGVSVIGMGAGSIPACAG